MRRDELRDASLLAVAVIVRGGDRDEVLDYLRAAGVRRSWAHALAEAVELAAPFFLLDARPEDDGVADPDAVVAALTGREVARDVADFTVDAFLTASAHPA
jgi:hypothetical protein